MDFSNAFWCFGKLRGGFRECLERFLVVWQAPRGILRMSRALFGVLASCAGDFANVSSALDFPDVSRVCWFVGKLCSKCCECLERFLAFRPTVAFAGRVKVGAVYAERLPRIRCGLRRAGNGLCHNGCVCVPNWLRSMPQRQRCNRCGLCRVGSSLRHNGCVCVAIAAPQDNTLRRNGCRDYRSCCTMYASH